MSDASHAAKSLRDRLGGHTEDRLGRALSDLLDNPLLTGAIGRAFDAREKATQAQEVAMGALNLPSATDIERLTRRLRSLSQRRLSAIESQLDALLLRLDDAPAVRPAAARRKPTARTKPPAARAKPAARRKPPATRSRKGA
jgi:hypothetical protein